MSLQPFLLYKIELFAVDILLIVFNKYEYRLLKTLRKFIRNTKVDSV